MDLKYSAFLIGKLFLFAIIFTVCLIIGTLVSGLANTDAGSSDSSESSGLVWLLLNSVITVSLLAWPAIRTNWPKWKSMIALFFVFFLIGTLLPQLDTLFFRNSLEISRGQVGTIILSGAICAILYIPISVLAFQKKSEPTVEERRAFLASIPYKKIGLLPLVYVVIYYLFGYFVAWQSAGLREFYSGTTDLLPFWEHLASTWNSTPSLFGLQIIRGLLWSSLAFLIGSMINGRNPWEKVFLISLLFSFTNTLLLFLPNPYMPELVRKVHFIEGTTSNFLFGFIAGWLLFVRPKRQKSAR